jgi:hypothetical protein
VNRIFTAALLVAAVAVPQANAHAAKPRKPRKHTRTVTIQYKTGPVLYVPGVVNGVVCNISGVDTATCVEVPLKSDEYYVKMVAADTTTQPAAIQWHEGSLPSPDAQNGYDTVASACGSTTAKLRKPKQIVVYVGTDVPDCALSTTGTLTLTISNLP